MLHVTATLSPIHQIQLRAYQTNIDQGLSLALTDALAFSKTTSKKGRLYGPPCDALNQRTHPHPRVLFRPGSAPPTGFCPTSGGPTKSATKTGTAGPTPPAPLASARSASPARKPSLTVWIIYGWTPTASTSAAARSCRRLSTLCTCGTQRRQCVMHI